MHFNEGSCFPPFLFFVFTALFAGTVIDIIRFYFFLLSIIELILNAKVSDLQIIFVIHCFTDLKISMCLVFTWS